MSQQGDVLVVWKLDRLGRSLQDLIQIIKNLKEKGVGFRSLTESIDTTQSSGMLIFHIFASLAEFEKELVRERTIAGLEAAKKKGKRGGRPKSLGDEQREILKQLLEEGRGVSAVARVLNTSRQTIYREKLALSLENHKVLGSCSQAQQNPPKGKKQTQKEKEEAKLAKMLGKALQANDPNQLGFF